jgi:hypothetical protein
MMIGNVVKSPAGMDVEISEEMFDGAVEYKEVIDADRAELMATPGNMKVEGLAEVRVHARSIDDRVWGTSDFLLFKKGKKLICYDYKFGKGVIVDPEENKQATIYLIGAMDTIAGEAFTELEVVIVQPRGAHEDGTVRRWAVPKEWIAEFRAKAKAAAAETLNPKAALSAGPWCRWCAAKPLCPAVHAGAQEAAMMAFDVVAPPAKTPTAAEKLAELRLLPIEKAAKILEWEGALKALVEAAKDLVREELSAGRDVPGWKLVEGRMGNREWIDEDAVVAELAPALGEDNLYEPRKIKTPAKIEKIVGKKHPLDHLVTRKPGDKAIARDTDPRPKVASAAQDAFSVPVLETTAEKVVTDCAHKFSAHTGGHHHDCPSCAEENDDLMAQLNGKVWP